MIKAFKFLFLIHLLEIDILLEGKKIILISPSQPLINCNIGETGISNFNGFEINLINEIMIQQKFVDWEYECIDSKDWQTKILDTGKYIGYAGRVQIDYKNNQGILFSQPYWNTGLSILTYQSTDYWQYLRVFSLDIYFLVAGTCFILGLMTFFLEKFEQPFENYLWNSFSNIFFINTINLKRSSSRLVQIGFWFLMLLVISSYTAHLTVIILKQNQYIQNSHQLNQRIVSAPQKYSNILYYYGAQVQYNYDEKNLNTSETLKNTQLPVDAVVIEDYFAKTESYTKCDVYIRQRIFHQIGYAFAFSVNQDSTLIFNLNQAIQELTDVGIVEKKLNKYISGNFVECKKIDSPDALNFHKIGGLFIVLCIGAAAAIVCFIFTKLPISNMAIKWLQSNNIISGESEIPQFGDELVAQNLKKTVQKIADAQQTSILKRMDLLDNKVNEFYQLLFNEEYYKKQTIIQKEMEKIDNILIEQLKKHDDTSNNLLIESDSVKSDEPINKNGIENSKNYNWLPEQTFQVEEEEEVKSEELQSDLNYSDTSKKRRQAVYHSPRDDVGVGYNDTPRDDPVLINASVETPRSINLLDIIAKK